MDKLILSPFEIYVYPAAGSCRRAGMGVIQMFMFIVVVGIFVFGLVGSVYSSYKYSKNNDESDRYD